MEPDPTYSALRIRLLAVSERTWRRGRDLDLRFWLQNWAIGLGFLAGAAAEARASMVRWNGWSDLVEGRLSGPAEQAARDTLNTSALEQYHELCLVSLSQPLLEALAVQHLGVVRHVAGLEPGERVPLLWPRLLGSLEGDGSTAPALLASARLVEATLGTGRDRLVAHVVPGSLGGGGLRDATGTKKWGGRITWEQGPAKARALLLLRELNLELPTEHRSTEANIYELARDLSSKAGTMSVAWGARLQSVATAVGFQLDFRAAASALVDLLEELDRADEGAGPQDHH